MLKRFPGDLYLLLIILVGLSLRLHKLDAPITDADSFRQGATASIARNYHEGGCGLLDPRITGWGSLDEPGLWPNEFPLYPYVVGQLYSLTGEHEWVGRLITIFFCLAGAAGLYDLIRRWEGVLAARFAALWFLIAPQAVYHGRCFHRHPVAIGLLLLALAAYARWLDAKRIGSWLFMTICGGLALILMPPLITVAPPVLWMYVQTHDRRIWKDRSLLVSAVLMLIPSLLWYGWAMQQPQSYSLNSWGRETFRNWTSLSYYTLWWDYDFFRQVWRGLWYYTLGPVGALFGALGVFLRRGRIPSLAFVWTAAILLYYLLDIHPIAVAPHYVYYLIILCPLCWGAGRFSAMIFEQTGEKSVISALSIRLLFVAALLLTSLYHWDSMIQPWYRVKYQWMDAAQLIQKHTPPDAKIIIDVFDPSLLYYARRSGVAKNPSDLTLEAVQQFEKEGADYLAIVEQPAFFTKDALRFYLKDSAENVIINETIRLYELGAKRRDAEAQTP